MAPCCSITDTFDISLRDLVDYYFVPLKACIDIADVGAFMCSCALISLTPRPADSPLFCLPAELRGLRRQCHQRDGDVRRPVAERRCRAQHVEVSAETVGLGR